MTQYRIQRPPAALRRRGMKLDNIALVPASLLPFKDEWQAIANRMPKGSVLLCAKTTNLKQRRIIERVAAHLKALGRRGLTIPSERVAPSV